MIKIKGAKTYINGQFEEKDIFIDNNSGRIRFDGNAETVIDARGMFAVPGFIDIHIHGAMGCDFNDGSPDGIDTIAQFVASHGTTCLLATTSTISADAEKNAVSAIKEKMLTGTKGACIGGLHMEGPFFNPSALGAQNPEYVQKPSFENLEAMLGENISLLKLLALAPETDGAFELIEKLSSKGIRTAVGHTAADYATVVKAINSGCNMMTHFYNAMTPLKHREPGAVGAVFDNGHADIQLICDLIHVHPAAIRIAVNNVGEDHVIMISDAISGTGLGDGKYNLGGLDIFVNNGIARIKEGNLAGSTLTLDTALKNMIKSGFKAETAIKFLTENPAKAIKLDNCKGFIKDGFDADIVLLDSGFNVLKTFVNGKQVFSAQ